MDENGCAKYLIHVNLLYIRCVLLISDQTLCDRSYLSHGFLGGTTVDSLGGAD